MNKPKVAGLKSIRLSQAPGTYYWCSCGHSLKQPFCDGSHKAFVGFSPMAVQINDQEEKKWCSCKQTQTPPFCDHSHRQLEGESRT